HLAFARRPFVLRARAGALAWLCDGWELATTRDRDRARRHSFWAPLPVGTGDARVLQSIRLCRRGLASSRARGRAPRVSPALSVAGGDCFVPVWFGGGFVFLRSPGVCPPRLSIGVQLHCQSPPSG